jgi:carboxymethylenebutenolidase
VRRCVAPALDIGAPFDTFSLAAHAISAAADVLARRLRLWGLMRQPLTTLRRMHSLEEPMTRFLSPALRSLGSLLLLAAAPACARQSAEQDVHAEHASLAAAAAPAMPIPSDAALPAGALDVAARLARSPRHGEWVMIRTGPSDSVKAWVVYPERASKAPVVVVVHEIYGLSTWVRGVADQLAADGFIAIAPDLLTGKATPAAGSDTLTQAAASAAIRTLAPADVQRQIAAVGQYGMSLPAAEQRYGTVGYCWGGGTSFMHAVASPPGLGASVVYYGTSPADSLLARVKVPVLGLYGGEDARVNATVPGAQAAMRALGKSFEPHTFAGAGHGFLRQQDGQNGANLAATREAWPLTIAFFRTHLGR